MATNSTKTTVQSEAEKNSSERRKSLDVALSYLEKQFGKGSIMRLGQKADVQVEVISTGSLAIDMATGVNGFPRGRVIEIYGPESSGKTTFALGVIAQCQKAGGNCAFVDAEHALDPIYARKLGVQVADLLVAQPDHGEQALEITDTLVRSGGVDVVVVDSVAALVPKQELEGDMEQTSIGLQARLMSKALRKITGSISKTNCIVIFINQTRLKIGIAYGNPETTTGGTALKFYSSMRLEIKRGKAIMKGDVQIGSDVSVKIVKNKVAPPFKKVEVEMIFGRGISREGELATLAEKMQILDKTGSWYSYGGTRIGQGKDSVKQYILDHPDFAQEIEDKIRKLGLAADLGEIDLSIVESIPVEE